MVDDLQSFVREKKLGSGSTKYFHMFGSMKNINVRFGFGKK